MKNRITRSMLSPALITAASLLLAVAPAVAEESVDEILNNYYEAVGGKDAWAKVKNMKQVGTMAMMGMEAPFTVHAAEPNKVHIQFEMQGMTGIQAFDGETGWMVMPFMGSDKPEQMPKADTDGFAATSGVAGPLFDYKAKGSTIELVGKADVEGTDTYHLKVTLESGKTMDVFLDAEYYIPIQQKMVMSAMGQEMDTTTTFSDYKEVDGVMFAFTTTQSMSMGSQVMTMDTIELNVDIPENLFTMPTPEESTPEEE